VGSLNRTFISATFKLPNQASKGVVVRSVEKPAVGDYVAFGTNLLQITGVDARGGTLYVLSFAANTNISAVTATKFTVRGFQESRFQPLRFKLAVTQGDTTLEEYRNLALDAAHPQYYFKDGLINRVSPRISVSQRPATAGAISEATMPASVARTQSGADVAAQSSDFRKGFDALEAETEPAMVICPDALTLDDPLLQVSVIGSMVTHCERFRRYAIVDAPNEPDDQELVKWRNASVDSTYAGVFAPHLKIVNLNPDAIDRYRLVPPSGFIAGVFARTDRDRGVHKAPGNERIQGIVGLAENYTTGRQDLLNPVGVNLIRIFPQRGTRLWGARNATDDVTWRYVNVRRLFNMIETSVERGTQWVVFEPNTRSTWLRVKVSMENFLDQQFRAGALAGASAAEAYRVRVGLGETMTETDVDLGLIVIEVAIAPAKPAEFVVFRFSHKRLAE
jgi:phage tail sheath protein FI